MTSKMSPKRRIIHPVSVTHVMPTPLAGSALDLVYTVPVGFILSGRYLGIMIDTYQGNNCNPATELVNAINGFDIEVRISNQVTQHFQLTPISLITGNVQGGVFFCEMFQNENLEVNVRNTGFVYTSLATAEKNLVIKFDGILKALNPDETLSSGDDIREL